MRKSSYASGRNNATVSRRSEAIDTMRRHALGTVPGAADISARQKRSALRNVALKRARSGLTRGPIPARIATPSHRLGRTPAELDERAPALASVAKPQKVAPSQANTSPISRPDVEKSHTGGKAARISAPAGST